MSKPIEIKIPDALFIRINPRKNHFQFTDLSESYAHYSAWFYGSTFDLHKTLEPHNNLPKRQIPIAKMEFNMETCMNRIAQDLCANYDALVRIVPANSLEWRDLEFDFIPIANLTTLFSDMTKGNRWTFTAEILDKFESAFHRAKLGDLAESNPVMGKSSQGHLMLGCGERVFLFDTNKSSEIIEKNIHLSLRP